MSANGDKTLRCHAPGCKSPVLRGAERKDEGHATDSQGRPYHFRCYWRLVRDAIADPTGSAA